MRWLGVALFLVGLFAGPPYLFLENWFGELIVVSCLIALVAGVVLMLQPYSAQEAAGGTREKDRLGVGIVAGGLVGAVAVAALFWRTLGS